MSDIDPNELSVQLRDEQPVRRALRKRVMHAVRRAHLYCGLFLLPWAVLYGVTGFLFNHPSAFADAPTLTFGPSELVGTPMEVPPKPEAIAAQVVTALNERAKDAGPYTLIEPAQARYTRDFAFAVVRADGRDVSLLFDVNAPGGTVRSKPAAPPAKTERAPFATAPRGQPPTAAPADPLRLPDPLHERVKAAVPVVLDRTGFPTGSVTVTSVPDLSFRMSDGTRVWAVTYNALTGSVSGAPVESVAPPEEMSARRFLTRLHLASGFPGRASTKWFWAVAVDAMAFVMVFWSVSGLFMWWQVKATRRFGALVLLASAAAASALGVGMHGALTPK
ncbi:PepSY domain-containing protein [Frigoriglobus tundricola]|uniref:PepSY domain-containing protein n=1 Tax=Frigoriglobus tundricola TaxID=2774151 RepID=A0A6M5YX22_9BACT|nr:PepSY domain-containing protein [Frigoriglobus tundricola]QJW97492.1 hypothetical protein FTUN_5066 [Frigoriglobus tundricola]